MVITFYYHPLHFPFTDTIDEGVSVEDMWTGELIAVDVKLDIKKKGREELIEKFKNCPWAVVLSEDYFRIDVTKLTNEEKEKLLQLLQEVDQWLGN